MDLIEALLRQTGWNCDTLIQKTQEYKLNLRQLDTSEEISYNVEINSTSEKVSEVCTTNNLNHHVSLEEVANDHSYTCRTVENGGYELQKNVKEDQYLNSCKNSVEKFLRKTKRIYTKKYQFLRKLKRRYRLQRKYASTDRKILIYKYKSKERVRSEIMHQLELLRSKRTLGINSNIKQTIGGDTIFLKKRYSGEKLKENDTLEEDVITIENNCDLDGADRQDIQSDSILEEEISKEESAENKDLQSIKPTKTNDITKIKGWKNKKFVTADKSNLQNGIISSSIHEINDENILENKALSLPKADTKSAFASTNLDGFLHDSANLHISFEIPTLDSGNNDSQVNSSKDDLQEKPEAVQVSPLLTNNEDELLKVLKVDPLNLYRPRTLGQKRRIWKLRTDTNLKKKLEDVAKPRTLAEKRRMMDYDMDVRNRLKTGNAGENAGMKYSFVLHRGRKLKIPTRSEDGIIAYIKSHYGKRDYIYIPKKVRQNKIKPSIFATTPTIQPQVMRYRPGPLSKKVLLQEYNKDWKTEIKTLPKVYLHVTPHLCKPISPRIRHLLPEYGFELTEERISFALSTLNTDNPESFTFPVPYANNQEYMLLRRKVQTSENGQLEPINTEDNKTVEETVQNVIDKMLDYVEIKGISDEVVMDDVTEKILREERTNIIDQQNNMSKKKKTKQSKTNYELKRLNVKVIEVNLEDKGESGDCKKEFCKLGCVCKSLSTTSSLVSNHCGVPDCMFKCNCNYEKKSKGNLKVTLPIGTDLLSEGAVNRLEVEAKKNLAKVEKEFTQTVIQANNQTIVVGGCTNRQRRVTKLPKKYTDFIEDPEGMEDVEQIIDVEVDESKKVGQKLKNWKPVPCTVYITKLNLDQVVPYCMVHHLYDCYCEYKAAYETKKDEDNKSEEASKSDDKLPTSDELAIDYDSDVNLVESSARTKGLPTNYYLIRNKSEKFLSTRKRKLEKLYRDYMDGEEKSKRALGKEEDIAVNVTEESQTTSPTTADTLRNTVETSNEKRTRRKQILILRRNSPPTLQSENAMQRRKKHKKHINVSLDSSNSLSDTSEKEKMKSEKSEDYQKTRDLQERIAKFEQIFQTASTPSAANLFTPSSMIQEKLSEILGRNIGNKDVQFRLIPWDVLIKKYESNSLKLWYSTYFKKPRIIATDNRTLPKHFVNVRNYENVPNKEMIKADVVRWLVTRSVPICNSRENIFIIVQLTKTHCELCGLWEKKQNNQADKMVLISQPSEKMYSIVKKIMFSKCKFSKQTLIQGGITMDSQKIPAISVYLPQISNNSKWRMIRLNSDFSVLSLHRNKYAIKYSDLQKVMKMAKETSFTIVLKTPEVETNYPHPDFGIYASPDCDDTIFIGPYFHNEDHDITTLRYVNRELIRTEVFCTMKGIKPPCNGFWLYQLPTSVSTPTDNLQTIDLTAYESDSETKKAKSKAGPVMTSVLKSKQVEPNSLGIRKKYAGELITQSDLLNYESCATDYLVPENFYQYMPEKIDSDAYMCESKIYFLPNVPNMGFILGYKSTNQVIIQWPSAKYIVKFPQISDAIAFLERELNTYFIMNPCFRIWVEATPAVDLTKISMFNPDMLKGYYVACPTGIKLLLEINKAALRETSLTITQLESLAKQRAQRMIFDKCYELVAKLFLTSKLAQPNTTKDLLYMLINEVRYQEVLHAQLTDYHNKLIARRRTLRLKCTAVITELQPLVSPRMQKAMQKILNFNKSLTKEGIEEPETTEESGKPEKPAKLEKSAKPEKPAKPGKLERLPKLDDSFRFELPATLEKPERSEKPAAVEKPGKPENHAKPENPIKFEKSVTLENSAAVEKPGKPEKHAKPENPIKFEKSVTLGRPGNSEKPAKLAALEKLGIPESSAKVEKLVKSQKPVKHGISERPAKTENSVPLEKIGKFEKSQKLERLATLGRSVTLEKPEKPENSAKLATSPPNSKEVICIDVDSEEEAIEEVPKTTPESAATPIPPPTTPPAPKITVKKIQDLKEPTNSAKINTKIIDLKNFSLLRDKSSGSDISVVATNDAQKLPVSSENSSNSLVRPTASSSNCKTFTIKRTALGKKCPKFVIKTTNGKYMTIRAEDLKELPMKKLQPIAPNDPVMSKLSHMTTKRILMPAKGNGFLKLNFAEKPSSSDKTVKNTVENGQQSNETSSSSKQT